MRIRVLPASPGPSGTGSTGKEGWNHGVTEQERVPMAGAEPHRFLGENVLHHVPVHIGEPEVPAGVAVGEPLVIHA